jgi:hypothetical protein
MPALPELEPELFDTTAREPKIANVEKLGALQVILLPDVSTEQLLRGSHKPPW